MRQYQQQQSQSELSYLESKLRMVSLLYQKAFPPKRDPAEEAVEQLQRMPSDRRGQQLEIDITNPEIIHLISGQRDHDEKRNFKMDVSCLGSYMGVPEISTILKSPDADWAGEDTRLSTLFEQDQSKLLDSLQEESVDYPDQIKHAHQEMDKMYRSRSAPRFERVEPAALKVSVLPAIDQATLNAFRGKNVYPQALRGPMPHTSKSLEKLARIKFVAARSLNRTQNVASKGSNVASRGSIRQDLATRAMLPSMASFSKGKLEVALEASSTARSAVRQALTLYAQSKRSKQTTPADWKKDM